MPGRSPTILRLPACRASRSGCRMAACCRAPGLGRGSTIAYDPADSGPHGIRGLGTRRTARPPEPNARAADHARASKRQCRREKQSAAFRLGRQASIMSETPSSAALRLTCQPSKSGNTLVFPYRLDNEGPGNVYAMQAVAAFGSASEDTAAIVIEAETGDVIVGTFMPPLPIDRRIAVPLDSAGPPCAGRRISGGEDRGAAAARRNQPLFPRPDLATIRDRKYQGRNRAARPLARRYRRSRRAAPRRGVGPAPSPHGRPARNRPKHNAALSDKRTAVVPAHRCFPAGFKMSGPPIPKRTNEARVPPAARITDMHVCPAVTVLVPHVGGPIIPPCAPTVLTGLLPQARVTDLLHLRSDLPT